jgi:hypothetical protein
MEEEMLIFNRRHSQQTSQIDDEGITPFLRFPEKTAMAPTSDNPIMEPATSVVRLHFGCVDLLHAQPYLLLLLPKQG